VAGESVKDTRKCGGWIPDDVMLASSRMINPVMGLSDGVKYGAKGNSSYVKIVAAADMLTMPS